MTVIWLTRSRKLWFFTFFALCDWPAVSSRLSSICKTFDLMLSHCLCQSPLSFRTTSHKWHLLALLSKEAVHASEPDPSSRVAIGSKGKTSSKNLQYTNDSKRDVNRISKQPEPSPAPVSWAEIANRNRKHAQSSALPWALNSRWRLWQSNCHQAGIAKKLL